MIAGPHVTINLAALAYNLQCVRAQCEQQQLLAMVKADAYGHGLLPAVRALSFADGFGVASLEEGMSLREVGVQQPIVVMSGFRDTKELQAFAQYQLCSVVHHHSQVQLLEQATLAKPLTIWLKVDSGMHRLGFNQQEFASAYTKLKACAAVAQPIVLMTHLADADNSDRDFTEMQLSHFKAWTDGMVEPKSIMNSAGILAYQDSIADWARPGIMLYGISPFAQQTGADYGLRPVMTLASQLIAVKTVQPGGKVGYGCTWQASEQMPIGVVAIGYGDGYTRQTKSGTPVLVNGVRCSLVGRVSMDMITVDLRPVPQAQVGDPVTLWGEGLPIEHVAAGADTIAYELLCQMTKRVKRIYTDV